MRSTLEQLDTEVAVLAAVSPSKLPVAGLQELITRTSALSARLEGIGARALGELQVRGGGLVPDGVDGRVCPTPAWLRSVTGASGHAAGRQVRTSVALRELPLILDAVVDGVISLEHGRILTKLVGAIEPQRLLDSQGPLLEVAQRADTEQLAKYVRHLIATWCEPALESDEAAAEDRRFFTYRNKHNGSWRGTFELPDAAMEQVLTVLEPLARRDGDQDKRTAGMRRADALTDVFGLAVKHAARPDAGGERPRLTYVLPPLDDRCGREFALDLDRHPGQHCPTGAWTGPATKAMVETLQCDARTDRLTVDADGRIVSLEAFTDAITRAQRRAVAARDRCCVAKGCTRPPAFCDVHHLRALADGGATEVDNLVLLCRRHHVMWHRQQLGITDLRVPWMRLPQPRAPALE
jgi:5-methylcytosine-specific restriction protein A